MAEKTVYKGDRKTLEFTITDRDGDAIDLTTYSPVLTVSYYYADNKTIIEKEPEEANSDGTCTFVLEPEETDIEVGVYKLEIDVNEEYTTPPENFVVSENYG